MKKTSTLLACLITGMSCWGAIAQTADDWVNQGLSALSAQDLNDANNDFASALSVSSTNENANALYAITRLLVLSSQPAGSNFLTRIGFPVVGRNLYDWTAELPEDSNGVPYAPLGVNANEFTAQLRTNVLNSVIGAVGNLDQIADTNFTIDLTSNETSIAAVTLDYGDLKLIQAGLYASEYFIYVANAQNVDAQLTDIHALYASQTLSVQSVLTNYPLLLTFTTTNDLQAARAAFTNAVNTYMTASAFIRARPTNEIRLFNYDQVSATNEATFRSVLQDLESSLSGALVLAADTNLTVNAATQFSGTTNWRSLLPSFQGNFINTGSFFNPVAVPDPTFGGAIGGLTQGELETYFDKHFRILQNFGLVQNGGFETREFTDWTLSGSETYFIFVDSGSITGLEPYSGYNGAAFGPVDALGYLSQTIPTTAGATYSLSFWLQGYGYTNDEFLASWNGNTLFDQKNIISLDWTNLQFQVTATGPATVLQFGAQNSSGWFMIDDVSVLPLPGIAGINVSGTNVTLNGINGFAGTTYHVVTSTNLAVPLNLWQPVATDVLSANGNFNITITNTVTPGVGQRFYILQSQ